MDLFANDLSIHHQFHDLSVFREGLLRLIAMRRVAKEWGREVYCSRRMAQAEPVRGIPMQKAIQRLSHPQKQAVMSWFTRGGPFWDEEDRHGEDEWLECREDIVTDSAVGEAAFRSLNGTPSDLISAVPSGWDYSPVQVTWRFENGAAAGRVVELENWRDERTLRRAIKEAVPPPSSWDELRETAMRQCSRLRFAGDCFVPLQGLPFASGAADRLALLFGILDRFAGCFDEGGERTPEGHQLLKQYFAGGSAVFSDSSDSEKRRFRNQLTFRNPGLPDGAALCGWHGKMRRHTIRFHFSWPVRASQPVYVVYVGPKITKS